MSVLGLLSTSSNLLLDPYSCSFKVDLNFFNLALPIFIFSIDCGVNEVISYRLSPFAIEDASECLVFNGSSEEKFVLAPSLGSHNFSQLFGEDTDQEVKHENSHDQDNNHLNKGLTHVFLVVKIEASGHVGSHLSHAAKQGGLIIVRFQVVIHTETQDHVHEDQQEDADRLEALDDHVNTMHAGMELCEERDGT